MPVAARARRYAPASAGFTLVEVLVALFVVALGIAGAAGVQALALRSAREAARMADGVQLAAALAERMRANPVAMALDDAANPYLRLDYDAAAGPPPAVADCYSTGCDAARLADFDLSETTRELKLRFPRGRVLACRDSSDAEASGVPPWSCNGEPGAPLVIKLGWPDTDATDAMPRVLLPVAGGHA